MNVSSFEVIPRNFKKTSEVPKDNNLYYHCLDCGDVIPSTPKDSIGCQCANIMIDKDCWRLVVADLGKFEVLIKIE